MDQEKPYQISNVNYRLEALSWQQCRWLAEHIFKGVDMHRLDYPTVHDLLREQGPLFMAICLLAEGETRAQQARRPWEQLIQRAQEFAAELTSEEVTAFGLHFFRSCLASPATMSLLTTGHGMRELFNSLDAPSPVSGATGSSAVSSSSAEGMSPSSTPSLPSGDRESVSPISSAASNGRLLITPS